MPEAAHAVAAVPYDVVSTEEARALAADNPLSFLHVSRAEIDLAPEADPHGDEVYRKAADNLARLRRDAPLVLEDAPSLYCYRLQDGDHEQTGLAGCYSLEEYARGVIKKHERTRRDKEDDRTRHMLALGAQTGVVFLTYRASVAVDTCASSGSIALKQHCRYSAGLSRTARRTRTAWAGSATSSWNWAHTPTRQVHTHSLMRLETDMSHIEVHGIIASYMS